MTQLEEFNHLEKSGCEVDFNSKGQIVYRPKQKARIAICNACEILKHGVKTRISLKHTC